MISRFEGVEMASSESRTEWAGSVDTRRILAAGSASDWYRAAAVAHVVFPVPPLPPKMSNLTLSSVRKEGSFGSIASIPYFILSN